MVLLNKFLIFIGFRKPKVIFLHGLPCSGKTTYANKLLAANPKLIHISYDDEVQKIAEENGMTYNDLFRDQKGKNLRKAASRALQQKIENHINQGNDMIFDLTNTSYHARRSALSHFDKTKYIKEIHIMPHLDKQEFIDREMNRYEELLRYGIEKSINVAVYDKFAKDYTRPTKKEKFDKIVEINL